MRLALFSRREAQMSRAYMDRNVHSEIALQNYVPLSFSPKTSRPRRNARSTTIIDPSFGIVPPASHRTHDDIDILLRIFFFFQAADSFGKVLKRKIPHMGTLDLA